MKNPHHPDAAEVSSGRVRVLTRRALRVTLVLGGLYLVSAFLSRFFMIWLGAPSWDYVLKRGARELAQENYALPFLFESVSGILFLTGILFLLGRLRLPRTGMFLAGLVLALTQIWEFFQNAAFASMQVELSWELFVYSLENISILAADSEQAFDRVPVAYFAQAIVVVLLGWAWIGFLWHRSHRREIPLFLGYHAPLVFGNHWRGDIGRQLILLGLIALTFQAGQTARQWDFLQEGEGVLPHEGAPAAADKDWPNKEKVQLKRYPHVGYFRERYGFNLPGNTNIVIFLLESVRAEFVDLERTRHFKSGPTVLQADYFFVPIPHSSNSLFSLYSGDYSSRKSYWNLDKIRADNSLGGLLRPTRHRNQYIHSGPAWYDKMDKMAARMFTETIDIRHMRNEKNPRTGKPYQLFSWGIDDAALFDKTMKTIREKDNDPEYQDRPLNLTLSFSNTHINYLNPQPEKYNRFDNNTNLGEHRNAIDYNLDLIDQVVDEFIKRGWDKNTLFVLVADHGESFGEYGFYAHDFSLYNTEARVPFALRHPAIAKLDDINKFRHGTFLDIYPTILDMLGLRHEPVHGRSLFDPNYELSLVLRSWGSDSYVGYVNENHKWIYSKPRRQWLKMTLEDKQVEKLPWGKAARDLTRHIYGLRFKY